MYRSIVLVGLFSFVVLDTSGIKGLLWLAWFWKYMLLSHTIFALSLLTFHQFNGGTFPKAMGRRPRAPETESRGRHFQWRGHLASRFFGAGILFTHHLFVHPLMKSGLRKLLSKYPLHHWMGSEFVRCRSSKRLEKTQIVSDSVCASCLALSVANAVPSLSNNACLKYADTNHFSS